MNIIVQKAIGSLQLIEFCVYDDLTTEYFQTKLPKPTIVRSGGGLHVYFTLDNEVPTADWRSYGLLIKQTAVGEGLKLDGSRSDAAASVLRVVGTHNYKYPSAPEVEVFTIGAPTPVEMFHELLNIRTGSIGLIRKTVNSFGSNTRLLEPSVLSFPKMLERCLQFRAVSMPEAQKLRPPEPLWSMALRLTTLMDRGREAAHRISEHDPRYSKEYVDTTFDRYTGHGPTRCDSFQKYQAENGLPNGCLSCPSYGKITSPAQITRLDEDAPPLVVIEVDEEVKFLRKVPGLLELTALLGVPESAEAGLTASACEFILEGLHVQQKIDRTEQRGYAGSARTERKAPREEPQGTPVGGKRRHFN